VSDERSRSFRAERAYPVPSIQYACSILYSHSPRPSSIHSALSVRANPLSPLSQCWFSVGWFHPLLSSSNLHAPLTTRATSFSISLSSLTEPVSRGGPAGSTLYSHSPTASVRSTHSRAISPSSMSRCRLDRLVPPSTRILQPPIHSLTRDFTKFHEPVSIGPAGSSHPALQPAWARSQEWRMETCRMEIYSVLVHTCPP
jgi:hypothetical protein